MVKEGKEFLQLKKAYDNARYPNAGTPAYIISSEWLDKYKKYCFYGDLKHNLQPRVEEGHFTTHKPGMIINHDLLHHEEKYLKGTGTINDFETEVFDKYLSKERREKMHFEFINEEMWQFLKAKYGCDHVIKRYYIS